MHIARQTFLRYFTNSAEFQPSIPKLSNSEDIIKMYTYQYFSSSRIQRAELTVVFKRWCTKMNIEIRFMRSMNLAVDLPAKHHEVQLNKFRTINKLTLTGRISVEILHYLFHPNSCLYSPHEFSKTYETKDSTTENS